MRTKKSIITLSTLIILLACSLSGWGQELKNIEIDTTRYSNLLIETKKDSATQDSLEKICKERGHIIHYGIVTCIGWKPYFVDLENRTLYINHNPNYISGKCLRCGKYVSEPVQAKPDTTVIWKKKMEIE